MTSSNAAKPSLTKGFDQLRKDEAFVFFFGCCGILTLMVTFYKGREAALSAATSASFNEFIPAGIGPDCNDCFPSADIWMQLPGQNS
jgi:hypothetical protein